MRLAKNDVVLIMACCCRSSAESR